MDALMAIVVPVTAILRNARSSEVNFTKSQKLSCRAAANNYAPSLGHKNIGAMACASLAVCRRDQFVQNATFAN